MTPYEHMRPGIDGLVQAARRIAFLGGLDLDTMENIVRKVDRSARREMFLQFVQQASNDTDPIG